jgi:anti-anti-sigma factor
MRLSGEKRMEITFKSHSIGDGTWVVSPEGSIDYATASEFEKKTQEILNKNAKNLLLDMAGVKYISSIGLSAIIQLMKRSKDKGATLALYDPQIPVKRVLEISKLDFLQLGMNNLEASSPFAEYIRSQEPNRQKIRESREKEKLSKEIESAKVAKSKKK